MRGVRKHVENARIGGPQVRHPGKVRGQAHRVAARIQHPLAVRVEPGTQLCADPAPRGIDDDGVRWIYVHSLYDGDPAAVAEGSLDMQNHILAAMRRTGFDPRAVDQTNRHHPRRATT